MAKELVTRLWKQFMGELWGFFALTGLLALHTGIILTVYAIKEVTSHNDLVQALGIVLILLGMTGVLFSWFFHRQQREKRPLCPWGRYACPCCRCCSTLTPWDDDCSTRARGGTNPQPAEGASVFSTPEFRRYSAFLKHGTPGVERSKKEIQESARLHKFANDASASASRAASSTASSPQGSPIVTYGRSFVHVGSRSGIEEDRMGRPRDMGKKSQAYVDI